MVTAHRQSAPFTRWALLSYLCASVLFGQQYGNMKRQAKMRPRLVAYRSFQKELAETEAFAEMGVTLRAFGVCNTDNAIGKPYSDYPPVWLGSGEYDFLPLERMVADLLEASPEAEFICLLDLNTPRWLARQLRIDSFDAITHAAAMPRWREETKRYVSDLVGYMEERWGGRIRAYSLMAGLTTEWFEFGNPVVSSLPKDAAWRRWRTEHGLPIVDSVPTPTALSQASFEGVIYDPATEAEKIDYWRFHNSLTADALLEYAHEVRQAIGPEKQIGAFFGYWFICNKGLASIGHLDYERVAASPDIDFFSSPATYTKRQCGFGTGSMAVAGTLRRHGKRVLHEIDFWPETRTPPWKARKYWNRPEETLAGNVREAAFAFVNGMSWWWFDMWGGMFSNPDVRRRIARITELHTRFGETQPPPETDILVVADPDSAYGMVDPIFNMSDDIKPGICPDGFAPANGCGEALRNVVNRIGATYGTCSFGDLPHIDLSKVKLVCLPATWTITPEKEQVLRDYVCRDGRAVLWTYAPGVSNGITLDADRIGRWAGVPFKTPEISSTRMDGWTSVYAYDWRLLTPAAMRAIAVEAGCFLYSDEMLPVCCNGRMLAVHCEQGGEKTIRLPRRVHEVVDILDDRVVARDCDSFTDEFATPDTKLYGFEIE